MRSEEVLNDFIDYCKTHSHQRFWQALSNWSGYKFIYGSDKVLWGDDITDTYYFEGKNK